MSSIFDDAMFDDAEQLEEVTVRDELGPGGPCIAAYATCPNPACGEGGVRIAVGAKDALEALKGNASPSCALARVPVESGAVTTVVAIMGPCPECKKPIKIAEEPARIHAMLNALVRRIKQQQG